MKACLGTAQTGILGLVNLLSGGALLKLTVFALGIMPYITASIILQLLAVVIPRLEALRQEGPSGTAKITQYTRYLTIGLAILQSTGYIELARNGTLTPGCSMSTNPIIPDASVFRIATANGPATTLALMEAAERTGVTVHSLSVQSTTLDDVFVHYTGRALRDALQDASPQDSPFMLRRG